MKQPLILNPEADTQRVNQYLTDWFTGNYSITTDFLPPTGMDLYWMTDLLKISLQVHAIHNVAESLAKINAGYFFISPEYPGPALWTLRSNDPLYTHYRNTHFLLHRANLSNDQDIIKNILRGYVCSEQDPNGGRHRLNADQDKFIYPSTPAIGTDFPKALGTALSIHLPKFLGMDKAIIDDDAICVVCGGDGTIDHPTVLSACNLSNYYMQEKHTPVPLLMVITDNNVAISERCKNDVATRFAHWGFPMFCANSNNPFDVYEKSNQAIQHVRQKRQVAVLVIKTYRLFGHSSNRRNENFTEQELQSLYCNNPLLYLMQAGLNLGIWTREDCQAVHDQAMYQILNIADQVTHEVTLKKADVAKPLQYTAKKYLGNYTFPRPEIVHAREAMSFMYREIARRNKQVMIIGQDQPGHYGVMLGVDSVAPKQIFGFPIDEIGLGGIPNGLAYNNILTITECSYKQYAVEGLLSGMLEWQMQRFLCVKTPPVGRIIRSPFGISKGGPAHSENVFYELAMVPQANVMCAGTPYSAALVIHLAYHMAKHDAQCVWINEPTRLYSMRAESFPGDCSALFHMPREFKLQYNGFIGYSFDKNQILKIISEEDCFEHDVRYQFVFVTFGNGVEMALRAIINQNLHSALVVELPGLKPTKSLWYICSLAKNVIIADETRPVGSPGNAIKCFLIDKMPQKAIRIVLLNSGDTFNPSGPALPLNYLSTADIENVIKNLHSV